MNLGCWGNRLHAYGSFNKQLFYRLILQKKQETKYHADVGKEQKVDEVKIAVFDDTCGNLIQIVQQ